MLEPGVIEHRESRPRRWLRERRVAIAVWIAVIEGLFFIVGVIPRLLTLAVAVLVVVGAYAARDVCPLENLALAAVMIAFSVAVFVWLLGLPLPLWPNS